MGTNNSKLRNATFLCLDNDSDSESSLSDLDEYDFDDLFEIRNFSYLYDNNYNSLYSNDVNNLNADSNIEANSTETDEFDESDESNESDDFNRSNISLVAIAEFNSNNTSHVSNSVDAFTQINEDDLFDVEDYENFHIWYTNSNIYNRFLNNYFLTMIRSDDISTNNNYDNELFV